ncbi:helix-turn-helix domain-containing protein [Desulfospira joergensenii]|uniref:helix-turn-helix domain-containing protein n=1 Tax=Desulfospira joergensenii TaxID=53329 RepID=UPI0003B35466|nr:helix-turn-helix domain-containing protein [Desulfospira joergensenii]
MAEGKKRISSGIPGLDRVLNSLYIGDNVVWHDTAGSLALDFCLEFIQKSREQKKSIVYVSFDRSPKNLIEKLGGLAENQQLTILDCFTNGKGDNAQIFNKFYEKDGAQWPYQVIKITHPENPDAVLEAILGLHRTLANDVRFVFESLTGMADLWEGEGHVLKFYSHACPRLYELDTIAYWILEKDAHSGKLKAHINQIAQVAVDLSIDQGRTRLKVIKAENRTPKMSGQFLTYVKDGDGFLIEGEKDTGPRHDLGGMIRTFRKQQGMSQKELSRLVGVTASNISQIETNQVFPSIPALYRIAEHLSVHVRAFFQEEGLGENVIFPSEQGIPVQVSGGCEKDIEIYQITPFDMDGRAQLFLVRIFPGARLTSHFFRHKGEEIGYVLSGELDMVYQGQRQTLRENDTVCFRTDSPAQWINKTLDFTRIFWINLKGN